MSHDTEARYINPSCIACGGTGINSKGGACSPCQRTGVLTISDDFIRTKGDAMGMGATPVVQRPGESAALSPWARQRQALRDYADAEMARHEQLRPRAGEIPVFGAHMEHFARSRTATVFVDAIEAGKAQRQALDEAKAELADIWKKWNASRKDHVVHRALDSQWSAVEWRLLEIQLPTQSSAPTKPAAPEPPPKTEPALLRVLGTKKAREAKEEPPSLERFSQTLRDYQQAALDDALDLVEAQIDAPPTIDKRRLYSCPTGTGKGTIELALLKLLWANGIDAVIVTPSREVVRGFLERCGAGPKLLGSGATKIDNAAETCGVWTPTRLRNRIAEGTRTPPEVVIYDEGHHAIDDNQISGDLFACCPYSVFIGYTATAQRGTPRGTLQLRAAWGEHTEILGYREAVDLGYVQVPRIEIEALCDDDQATVANGEFKAKSASKLYGTRIEALAEFLDGFVIECPACANLQGICGTCGTKGCDNADCPPCSTCDGQGYVLDKATMIAVPSTDLVEMLAVALDRRSCPYNVVTQETKPAERARAFAETRKGLAILVQIQVVGEGVDLPELRRIVDAKPTMSPVAWLQLVGRLRPGKIEPEYICTNRNFERHCYLLSGCIPPAKIRDAQLAFGEPSTRSPARSLGLERLARFKPLHLPLADGRTATVWSLYTVGDESKTEWCLISTPGDPDPLVAKREIGKTITTAPRTLRDGTVIPAGTVEYNYEAKPKWKREDMLPEELKGFASSPATGPLSDTQAAVWEKHALRKGLDPDPGKITRRHIGALFALLDSGLKIRQIR